MNINGKFVREHYIKIITWLEPASRGKKEGGYNMTIRMPTSDSTAMGGSAGMGLPLRMND